MLVLNTNEQWWWYSLSNNIIWNYPDFRDSILLWLWCGRYYNFSIINFNNWKIVKTVNWTPINWRITTVVEPYNYTWSVSWWSYSPSIFWTSWGSNLWTFTLSKRYWLNIPLPWWKTLWKNIKIQTPSPIWDNYPYDFNWTLKVDIKLLHSDWTLTLIWWTTFTYTYSWVSNSYMIPISSYTEWDTTSNQYVINCSTPPSWNEIISTAWVLSTEWDLIVVELVLNVNSFNNYRCGVARWYAYTPIDAQRATPIQISIE